MSEDIFEQMLRERDAPEVEEEQEKKEKTFGLFDIIQDMSTHGKLVQEQQEKTGLFPKEYNAYMTNSAFSNFKDTILIANEMNIRYNIPNEQQHDFIRNMVSPRKRFSKWYKPQTEDWLEKLSVAMGWSQRVTRDNLKYIPDNVLHEYVDAVTAERFENNRARRKRK